MPAGVCVEHVRHTRRDPASGGEVQEFVLLPVERVAEKVRETKEVKRNCNLVIIDFLVRHGLIPPDDPDYLEIVRGLRQ